MSMSSAISNDPRGGRGFPADPVLRERDERLESLKAVAGKLAHDFNNFLVPTYGYLTLMKDEIPAGSTAALYINSMDNAAQKAESYISSILLGMRPYRQFSPREFHLNLVVHELVERWKTETPEGTEIQVSLRLAPFLLMGDEKQWRIVIEQLLSNARYALAMGGQFEVVLESVHLDAAEVERLGLSTQEVFCLRVRDSGFGMNSETFRRAFEPFFTTRNHIKAAGLGLTMVHGITLFHGGQVELKSAVDEGTTVTLWIPARNAGQSERLSLAGLPAPRSRPKPRILVLTDDPLVKEVLRGWIGSLGLEPETASDEKEARRSLQRPGGNYALVICEADLKCGGGQALFECLRPAAPGVPWVFLCGQRKPRFESLSPADQPILLQKPVSSRAIEDLLRKWAGR